jgi:acetyl-CoA carboxylase carboxyltransferase component
VAAVTPISVWRDTRGVSGGAPEARMPVATGRLSCVAAGIGPLESLGAGLGDRTVAWFHTDPALRPPSLGHVRAGQGEVDTDVMARTVRAGLESGLPVVGVLRTAGLDTIDGLPGLDGWGRVAAAAAAASGLVPTVLVVDGPCVGGPALLLGLVDVVVMTADAWAYLNGPAAAARMTGAALGVGMAAVDALGGPAVHAASSGAAHLVVPDLEEALASVADLLVHLPDNSHEPVRPVPTADPAERATVVAAAAVPADTRRSYDVRDVIHDLVDDGDFLELQERFGTSVVTGVGRIGGQPVGLVANQPSQLAGALDIEGSQKGARFVRWCDAFGLPLVTLVDTPGFRPGKDQEWRGMIRHGAQLAYAYAMATVPRVCVLLRKAYGGAFIVMDCKTMGNDCCLAWPSAEIAVMGAAGAVEILHRRDLLAAPDDERDTVRKQLEATYEETHLSPRIAAERGYVDAIIDPTDTRAAVAGAIAALTAKREHLPRRRHDNTPL